MKKQEGRKVSLIPTSPFPPNLPFFVSHIIFPGCEISLGYKLSPCIFGEMHFPLDRSVACSADFVSKRESRLRWRLARRLSIACALPPCRQHLYSPRPISTNFYLTNFPVSAGIARFRVGSEAEDAKRGGRVVRGIRVVAMASVLGTSWSACKWITGIARGSRRRTDDWTAARSIVSITRVVDDWLTMT